MALNLSFPDSIYTEANKPVAATLKADLAAIETEVNTIVKATGAEINTGTNDAKFATAKAITDSKLTDAIRRDGWLTVADSWAYASASTITVPSGAASLYQKGDKIKLTQTTVKYFYIIRVADTVLTVTGGSNYTVANAAITSPFYSHQESPIGFPQYFNYVPIYGGFSVAPTVVYVIFSLIGSLCTLRIRTTGGTSNNTVFTYTAPIAGANISGGQGDSVPIATDNGTRFGGAICSIQANSTTIDLYKNGGLTVWTASGAKNTELFNITYIIA